MRRPNRTLLLLGAIPPLGLAAFVFLGSGAERLEPCTEAHRPAATYPDYSGVTVPPNLAPLNLKVLERGRKFCLRLSGNAGTPVEIFSSDGRIEIRPSAWRKLLDANPGGELRMDVYAKGDSGWTHFDTARNRIAADRIDPYVVYRYLPPVFNKWDHISIRQRDLRSFDERVLFDNLNSTDPSGKSIEDACVNCHTFLNHGTQKMLLHMRPAQKYQIPAMILVQNGRAEKIDTRNGKPPAAYITWHPNGKLLAFSRNRLAQIFHTAGVETRDVVDKESDLGLYSLESGKSFTVPQISRPDRLETFPTWSPDGKYLYFSSARVFWKDLKNGALDVYDQVRYDLMRIAYDAATGQWGQVETVIAAAEFGRSVSLAQISPDGRYLMFCGHAYGSFPIFQPSSDLYLLDLSQIQSPPVRFQPAGSPAAPAPDSKPLASGKAAPRRLDEINSDRTDSYHCWSANGRWVIFTSKREDGMFGRLYITHLEADGRFSKPLIIPQADPDFYGRTLMTFNRPELIREPVTVSGTELARAMNSNRSAAQPANATPLPQDERMHQ
jgi:hypothetical protein